MDGDEVLRLSAPVGAPCLFPGVRNVAAIVNLVQALCSVYAEDG